MVRYDFFEITHHERTYINFFVSLDLFAHYGNSQDQTHYLNKVPKG